MIMLYKYIFCKSYYFCIRFFKEKEFPWAFASGIITFCAVTSLVVFLEAVEYILLPNKINIYSTYHGFFAVALWVFIQIYVTRNKRYLKILETCKNIPIERQKILGFVSIVYILILFIGFFGLGYLIREYNLSH